MCWDISRKLTEWWTKCLYEVTSKHKVDLGEMQRWWLEGERYWGWSKPRGTSWRNRRLGTSCTGWLSRTLEASDFHVRCREKEGASRRAAKEGGCRRSGRLRGGFYSSAMDRLCRNRISSAQARKRRQPQSWRHRGRTACKGVQEVEVKIYWLFSI